MNQSKVLSAPPRGHFYFGANTGWRRQQKSPARKHDISPTLLRIWIDKFRRGELTPLVEADERTRDQEANIAALERKVGQLVMELDVLKKLHQAALQSADKPSLISGPAVSQSAKDAAR